MAGGTDVQPGYGRAEPELHSCLCSIFLVVELWVTSCLLLTWVSVISGHAGVVDAVSGVAGAEAVAGFVGSAGSAGAG